MKGLWWKILGAVLVLYAIIAGFLADVPTTLGMLDETIRNLFYHVPMWFAMIGLLFIASVYNVLYLNKGDMNNFYRADALIKVCVLFGALGIMTGMIWAKSTWGHYWTKDAKLNGAAAGMLIYGAYLILGNSMDDKYMRAKTLSIYNLFVYPIFIALIIIMPKLIDFSAHPGAGDTQGFTVYDMNNNLRKIFYPAVIGWVLLANWIASIYWRYKIVTEKSNEKSSIS